MALAILIDKPIMLIAEKALQRQRFLKATLK
jgi:hypothetical protein